MKFLVFVVVASFAAMAMAGNVKKPKTEYHTMNDGNKMPKYGFGTSAGGGAKAESIKAQKAIEDAITAGYRLLDGAEFYKNEEEVGKAIKNKIDDKTIKREDIFVVSKVWNNHHRRDLVAPALRKSLQNMKLDYVDLYLIHWPVEEFDNYTLGDTDYLETWEAMEEVKKLGLAKSIGVSNFNEKQLQRLIDHSKVKPAALEIEVNPNLTQKKLVDFCKQHGIIVIAYAPLGSMPDSKKKKNSPPPKIDDPILTEMAHKYNKNTVQIVLRYLVDREVVPIPKSTTTSRIYENFNIFDFCLTPDEIKKIDEFNKDYRVISVPEWKDHKYYPF